MTMISKQTPEYLYFKDVLGVESFIMPETFVASNSNEETFGQNSWLFLGEADSPLVCIETLPESEQEKGDLLLTKMMGAIQIYSFFHLRPIVASPGKPEWSCFSGNFGVVFGKKAFDSLQTNQVYGAVLGQLIHFEGTFLLVTRGMEEVFESPHPQKIKAEIWNHLKKLKEAQRAHYETI
ncbi:MAG: hypothetical protein KDD61_12035 [Bdellovibrionales bacterium]|nr:hypothetical protein [Bdellovibrionales bacterium]